MPSSRPNILFIFTDQQRADTLGVQNPVMRTPTMDRLCEEGTRFTNAHTPVPVCVPARCSMIFGQYATNTGCFENNYAMPDVTAERPTFMSALTNADYQTIGVGKMHFTPKPQALRGFEHRISNEEGAGPDRDDYARWLHEQGFTHITDTNGPRGEMYYIPQPAQMPAWAHSSHFIGDKSIDFLEHRDTSRPFMMMSSFIDPHPPFSPPTPWNKLYRAPSMPLPKLPEQYDNVWTYANRFQNRYKYRDQGIDNNLLRVMKAHYYATISFVDYNVGRILQVLERQGELDNTLILWSSDHGEFLGDYHCFGKRSFLASAANVPLIARYPERFNASATIDTPASLVDIMPTMLASAGVATDAMQLDGIDLANLAGDPSQREAVFGHYQSGQAHEHQYANYMALTDRYKYIYAASDNREYLFDRRVDPDETRNRAQTPGFLDITASMRQRMMDNLHESNFTEVLDGDNWRVYPSPQLHPDPDAHLLVQDPYWADNTIPGYTD